MHNIIAISTHDHTYLARAHGTEDTSIIFSSGHIVVAASTNLPGALTRLTSFRPSPWQSSEHISTFLGRVWTLDLAEHLKAQISPFTPDARFELFVAWYQHLFSIQHLPEKSFSAMRPIQWGATQYGADSDRCDAALEMTQGNSIAFRLAAALAAGASHADTDDIIHGRRRLAIAVA